MEIPVLSLTYIMGMVFLVGAAFFLIPKLAPFILVAIATVLLVLVGYMHYKQFGVSEYERNTWMDKLRDQSPFVLFGGILLIALVVYYASTYMQSQEPLPIPMPQAGGWLKGLFR
jgi:hypothetical protein